MNNRSNRRKVENYDKIKIKANCIDSIFRDSSISRDLCLYRQHDVAL
jgi:hypothetical protein